MSEQSKLVSVIVPSHKGERFLAQTLESVKSQTYRNWELVLIEDGVFDNTASIVKNFMEQVAQRVIFRTRPNPKGVSATRNEAVQLGEGDIIAFLDADDIWESSYLETAVSHLTSSHDVACFSAANFINENGDSIGEQDPITDNQLRDLGVSLYDYNFIKTASVVAISRMVWDRGLAFDESLSYGEDLDLWLKILAKGWTIGFTGGYRVSYRRHATSAMAQTVSMNQKMGDFYQKHYQNDLIPRSLRIHRLYHSRYYHARMTWRNSPADAAKSLRTCIEISPFSIRPYFWYLICKMHHESNRLVEFMSGEPLRSKQDWNADRRR